MMSNEAFEKWLGSDQAILCTAMIRTGDRFERDIAKLAWQAAKADSEQEIAELKAEYEIQKELCNHFANKSLELQSHINNLREALNMMRDAFDVGGDVTSIENDALYKADNALSKTPAQSLQEHDNEVIEKCAKELEELIEYRSVIDKIRTLKGK